MKPFKPPSAIATNMLVGLCVAVQAAVTLAGGDFAARLDFSFGLVPARLQAALLGSAEPVSALATLFTYMFLHSGWLHLGLNILFLAWVGRYVEWVTGRWALVGVFIAGGLAGGILQTLVGPASAVPVIGASGAIAAVFGAYAVLFAGSRAAGRRVLGISLSGDTLTSLWYAATWIGLQLLTGFVFNIGGGGMQIAIWTHIGGFIAGLLMGRVWGKAPRVP
ncbi:MAG: rhomboid family intramembrane serine protease [Polymorphobacter sp.]